MRVLSVILIFVSVLALAQTHRFIYDFKYKTDSLSNHFDNSEMVLDITGNEVQFYEYRAIRIDSINNASKGLSNYTFPFAKLKRALSLPLNVNYYFLGNSYFKFETSDKIKWEITSETKTKENWKVQKALATFGGRNWVAWFTTEIPFSEGPYKFNGLPGLVVELNDTKGNFFYDLVRIEKPQNANPNIVETLFKAKPLLISYQKYRELLIANYNDPYQRFRSMKPGTWAIGRDDDTYVETIEGLASITKEEQERIRKNNNQIEIDKAMKYGK